MCTCWYAGGAFFFGSGVVNAKGDRNMISG